MTSLTVIRRIKARPSIVFRALTTAEGMAQWCGPDGGPVLIAEADPRRGGCFRVRFRRLEDATEYESNGEFLEVVRPERIVMSWRWKDGVVDPNESRVEIVLRPVPEGTEITVTHMLLHDEESRRSHEAGWMGALDKLAARDVPPRRTFANLGSNGRFRKTDTGRTGAVAIGHAPLVPNSSIL